MAVSRVPVVSRSDCELLQCFADRDGACDAPPRDQEPWAVAQGQRERSVQGRHAEQVISADDSEGPLHDLWIDGAARGASQERGSLRQPSGEPGRAVRELPQSASSDAVVGGSPSPLRLG